MNGEYEVICLLSDNNIVSDHQ